MSKIDLRPTNSGYMAALRAVIQYSTNEDGREWARQELKRWERAVDSATLTIDSEAQPSKTR